MNLDLISYAVSLENLGASRNSRRHVHIQADICDPAAARKHWAGLEGAAKVAFRFHHISTDEVFGSLGRPSRPRRIHGACRTMGQWVARTMLDAGFAVTCCAPGEAQEDPAGAGPAMPENVKRTIVPDAAGVSEPLRQRSGYYNTVVRLGQEREDLRTGAEEALEGAPAGAILIDLPCRHEDAA